MTTVSQLTANVRQRLDDTDLTSASSVLRAYAPLYLSGIVAILLIATWQPLLIALGLVASLPYVYGLMHLQSQMVRQMHDMAQEGMAPWMPPML